MKSSQTTCPHCGYTSTNIDDNKCPECKRKLDSITLYSPSQTTQKNATKRSWYNDMYGDFDGNQIPY